MKITKTKCFLFLFECCENGDKESKKEHILPTKKNINHFKKKVIKNLSAYWSLQVFRHASYMLHLQYIATAYLFHYCTKAAFYLKKSEVQKKIYSTLGQLSQAKIINSVAYQQCFPTIKEHILSGNMQVTNLKIIIHIKTSNVNSTNINN